MGFLAAAANPAADFRYSAALVAMTHAAAALQATNETAWAKLAPRIGAGVLADFADIRRWRESHEGPAAQVSEAMNDAYLKINRQAGGVASYGDVVEVGPAGVASYGRMVDLLLALRRASRLPLAQ